MNTVSVDENIPLGYGREICLGRGSVSAAICS